MFENGRWFSVDLRPRIEEVVDEEDDVDRREAAVPATLDGTALRHVDRLLRGFRAHRR